jgi:hypothetical protein
MSDYFKSVVVEHPDVAERYQEKISKINGIVPFSVKDSELTYKPETFPPVANMDIVSYLVLTTSFYTSCQMKAYKSLNAFKSFQAGFVHNCGAIKINDYIVVVGRVSFLFLFHVMLLIYCFCFIYFRSNIHEE